MDKRIPWKYRLAARWQWFCVGLPYLLCWALTFFPMGLLVAATARYSERHPQGKPTFGFHKPEYVAAGSSGAWQYWLSPWRLLRWWNNYEDGALGEPSGKHSAREGGGEDDFWAIYRWLIRNPFNWGKRTSRLFACFVNDCELEWWGDFEVSDKGPVLEGWHFCRAVDRTTGRVYYGYREVRLNDDGTVYNATYGYKLRPAHAVVVQDPDDLDKAFTFRVQFRATVD